MLPITIIAFCLFDQHPSLVKMADFSGCWKSAEAENLDAVLKDLGTFDQSSL